MAYRARKHPSWNAACFHAQQAVEKYFKARMVAAAIPVPKTHDLRYLVRLLQPVEPLWIGWERELRELSDHAVELRYPGEDAKRDDARRALRLCQQFRELVRTSLGLVTE